MKIAHKLWAFLIALSSLASIAIGVIDYNLAVDGLHAEDRQHYDNLGRAIGRMLHRIDVATDATMRNALAVLASKDAEHGPLSAEEMEALSSTLHVSRFGWHSRDGLWKVFTGDPNADGSLNVFTLCNDYEDEWFGPDAKVVTTPFAPKGVPSEHGFDAEKFAMTANASKDRILSASLRSSEWGDLLSAAISDDDNIAKIGLYTPAGEEIAAVCAPHLSRQACVAMSEIGEDEGSIYHYAVASSANHSCECVVKGYTGSAEDYAYTLTVYVTDAKIAQIKTALQKRSISVVLSILLVSIVASHFLARRLTAGVAAIAHAAENITRASGFRTILPHWKGRDEIGRLVVALNVMVERLRQHEHQHAEKERAEALARQAAQVAHDIRSPMTSLQAVVDSAFTVPERERVMMRNGIRRINDIANNLSQGMRALNASTYALRAELVSLALEQIVSEQRQMRGVEGVGLHLTIDDDARFAFANMVPSKFKCVLSNLLNNAFEAIASSGRVEASLHRRGAHISLEIADSGCGIAPDDMARVLAPGGTVNKRGGFGMGLSDALDTLQAWKGRLVVCSAPNAGTTVQLLLPIAPTPAWFAPSVQVAPDSVAVILDDDAGVRDVLVKKIEDQTSGVRIFATEDAKTFLRLVDEHRERLGACFVDYQLTRSLRVTGIDVVEQAGVASETVLVTSWYEDDEVRARCRALGIRIFPKPSVANLPFAPPSASEPLT